MSKRSNNESAKRHVVAYEGNKGNRNARCATRVKQDKAREYDITMKGKGPVFYNGELLLHGQMFDLPEPKEKLPYEEIMKDFRMRHPNLGKNTLGWQPHGYATIRVWCDHGMVLDYNYDEHMAKVVKG